MLIMPIPTPSDIGTTSKRYVCLEFLRLKDIMPRPKKKGMAILAKIFKNEFISPN